MKKEYLAAVDKLLMLSRSKWITILAHAEALDVLDCVDLGLNCRSNSTV
jgi:hypothetical protein